MPATHADVVAAAERLDDLLTMLGIDPTERPEEGGPSTAEVLASAVLRGAEHDQGPALPVAAAVAEIDGVLAMFNLAAGPRYVGQPLLSQTITALVNTLGTARTALLNLAKEAAHV